MGLEVLHAVELSVALCTAEGAAARWVKLQPGPLASCHRLLTLLLTLAVMPPQQAWQVESLTTGLAGIEVGNGVAEITAGADMDSKNLLGGFLDGSRFCQLKDVWEL